MGISREDAKSPRKNTTPIRPLDMFLLGLVKGGLVHAYDWQAKARISLGASLPAARRLLDAGLLTQVQLTETRERPRDRREFALTPEGKDVVSVSKLRDYLEDALDQPPSDLESAIRLACLAEMIGDFKTAKKFLWEAAQGHRRRGRLARKRGYDTGAFPSKLGGLYSILLALGEAKKQAAIADWLDWLHGRWGTLTEEILQQWDGGRRRRE
jgi:DNA-binding PadR family transcriptional regulator